MASFLSLTPCSSFTFSGRGRPSFKPLSPTTSFAIGHQFRRKSRGMTVVTRAGPSTSSYVFAFAVPFSLLAITIFTSIRISDKLDNEFLEEMAMNEAIMEANEDGDDDDDSEIYFEEEPALPRTRNRPKREI